jgi:hypothetical protein
MALNFITKKPPALGLKIKAKLGDLLKVQRIKPLEVNIFNLDKIKTRKQRPLKF